MQDLNDLYYFAAVVDHGGFAPAGRALGIPKSKLSRRIAVLENRLGVRLIQRSTRRFAVTEIGQNYYAHCKAMLVEAQSAQDAIEPDSRRTVRRGALTCPVALLDVRVGEMIAAFMAKYPRVGSASRSDQPSRRRGRRRCRCGDSRAAAAARRQRPGASHARGSWPVPGRESALLRGSARRTYRRI